MKEKKAAYSITGSIISASLIIMALFSFSVNAVSHQDVDGEGGTLYVSGTLSESPCHVEMDSVYQEISMGNTESGFLRKAGDHGHPKGIELHITDCPYGETGMLNTKNDNLTYSPGQPVATISFSTTHDSDTPALIKAKGISGMGLRLLNREGKAVEFDDRGSPQLLTPGDNTLMYAVVPERTSAQLVPGSYVAAVDFHLNYD